MSWRYIKEYLWTASFASICDMVTYVFQASIMFSQPTGALVELLCFDQFEASIFSPGGHRECRAEGLGGARAPRLWRIVFLKVAYYATSSARNFANLCQNSQIMLLIFEIMLTKWRRFCTCRRAKTTLKYNVFQICCRWKFMCFMAVCLGPQLSKPRTQNLSKEA